MKAMTPSPTPRVSDGATLAVELPIRTVSTANLREHHMARHRRTKDQRAAVTLLLGRTRLPALPVAVTLTRIAPRLLDRHDNLPVSLKGVADAIAGLYGVDDRDPRISFACDQEQRRKAYAVRVEIQSAGVTP